MPTLVATAALIGLPLVIVGLAAAGLPGWIVAATLLPLVVFGVIFFLGTRRSEP